MAAVTRYASSNAAVANGGLSTPTAAYSAADSDASATATPANKNTTVSTSYSGFGFDGVIPDGATINSVTVTLRGRVSAVIANGLTVGAQARVGGVGVGTEATYTAATFGTATSTPTGLTRANLLDASFSVLARVSRGSTNTNGTTGYVESIAVAVDYTLAVTRTPLLSSASPNPVMIGETLTLAGTADPFGSALDLSATSSLSTATGVAATTQTVRSGAAAPLAGTAELSIAEGFRPRDGTALPLEGAADLGLPVGAKDVTGSAATLSGALDSTAVGIAALLPITPTPTLTSVSPNPVAIGGTLTIEGTAVSDQRVGTAALAGAATLGLATGTAALLDVSATPTLTSVSPNPVTIGGTLTIEGSTPGADRTGTATELTGTGSLGLATGVKQDLSPSQVPILLSVSPNPVTIGGLLTISGTIAPADRTGTATDLVGAATLGAASGWSGEPVAIPATLIASDGYGEAAVRGDDIVIDAAHPWFEYVIDAGAGATFAFDTDASSLEGGAVSLLVAAVPVATWIVGSDEEQGEA